jgi:hypothetical protein
MSESWALPSSLPTDILIITGFKSYCCKGTAATFVPPAFLEATWNTDCTGNCGVNQIKLALERGECRTGELAYCAKGVKLSDIPNIRDPDRTGEAPKRSQKVLDFEDSVTR